MSTNYYVQIPNYFVSTLTVTGEGERLSDVLTNDSDLYADPESLLQLLLGHTRAPDKPCILRALRARVSRTQPVYSSATVRVSSY